MQPERVYTGIDTLYYLKPPRGGGGREKDLAKGLRKEGAQMPYHSHFVSAVCIYYLKSGGVGEGWLHTSRSV